MNGAMPRGSSLELDMLTGMMSMNPDEFVPVDNFFQSYIDELNTRSKRAHEPVASDASKAVKMNAGQTAGMHAGMPLMAAQGVMPPGMGGYAMPQQQGVMMPGMAPPGMQPLGMLAPRPVAVAVPGGLPLGMLGGDPYAVAGAPAGSPAPYAAATLGASAGGMLGLDLQPPLGGGYGGGGTPAPADSADGGSAGGGDSRQRKTVKQQEANKIAQQRYRERKKQKFVEMEAQIGQLSKQLAALQALQSRNAMLEGLNGDLQTQLMSKEKEVERLKLALDVASERSLSGATHSRPSSPSGEGERTTAGAGAADLADVASHPTAGACDLLPHDMAGIDFRKGFADQVALLREWVQQHGVTEGAAEAHRLGEAEMMELGGMVARSCQLCQAALRSEGVRVIELISKDPSSFASQDSGVDAARWERCLAVMHLTPQQEEVLLLNRRTHLQRMRGIYEERQALNMQAMSLMLPHASANPAEDNTVEGRMANMSHAGYLHVARSSAELGDVLDRIKDNLRREQRAVMDLNCQLVSRVLSPLQSAHYMIAAFPQHCDALALGNTLAKHLGREEFSGGAGAVAAGCGGVKASSGCAAAGGCC